MKKLSLLFSALILLTAFTCENEPLEGDFVSDEPNVTCEQAMMNTATAAQNFATLTEENYEEEYSGVCIALKTAFENQLEACGDPDGSLQAAIDALGSCSLNASPCEIATSAAATAQQVYNQATEEEFTEACNAYAFVLQQKINECGDANGSIQDIIDGLGDCTTNQSNLNIVGTWRIISLTSNGVDELQEELDYSGICYWEEVYTATTLMEVTYSGEECSIQGNGSPINYTIDGNILSFSNGDDSLEILELTDTTLIYQDVYSELGENYTDIYTYERQ